MNTTIRLGFFSLCLLCMLDPGRLPTGPEAGRDSKRTGKRSVWRDFRRDV